MKNFGTQFFGQFTAFRLNCKMTASQVADMQEAYPTIWFEQIKGDLTRIEGALEHYPYHHFKLMLAIELAEYKSLVAHRKVEELREVASRYMADAQHEVDALAPLGDIRA